MAPSDAAVIRLWLENNLAEASKEGGDALDKLRDQVKAMGPEVEAEFNRMTGAVEKTTTATKKVVEADEELIEQAKKVQKATLEAEAAAAKVTEALDEEEAATRAAAAAANDASKDFSGAAAEAAQLAGAEGSGVGLHGVAGGAIKAEKAMLSIATGHGVGRVGGLLETLTSAAGLASGTGLALGALAMAVEVMLPKLREWVAGMDGAAKATERALKALENYHAELAKEEKAPSGPEAEAATYLKDVLAGKGAQSVRQGVETSLGPSDAGLTPDEAEALRTGMLPANSELNPTPYPMKLGQGNREYLEKKHRDAVQGRTGELMTELRAGGESAITTVAGMAAADPAAFGGTASALSQATRAGRAEAKRQSDIALANTEAGEAIYRQQELIRQALEDTDRQDAANALAREVKDEAAAKKAKADLKREVSQLEDSSEAYSIQTENEAVQKKRHEEAEQKRRERESTPAARNAAARRAEENEALDLVQQNTQGFTADQQQKIAGHMRQNYDMGLAVGHSVAQQIQYAIQQTRDDMQRGIMAGIRRSSVMSESFLPN